MSKQLYSIALLLIAASLCGCRGEAPEADLSELYSWTLRSDIYTLSVGENAELTVIRSDGKAMDAKNCVFYAADKSEYASSKISFDAVGVYPVTAVYRTREHEYPCCDTVRIQVIDQPIGQIDRKPYLWGNPMGETEPSLIIGMDEPVVFRGEASNPEDDERLYFDFPDDNSKYGRVILHFTMCGAGEGPGAWDQCEQFFVKDKATGEWFQILSAITCYGSGFRAGWQKHFYLDVTEFLPMLSGRTEFRYFGGGPTEANRWHAADLQFCFYECIALRQTVYAAKMYDSCLNPTHSSRGWRYGVASIDIEAEERMGTRTFTIPEDVKELELRYSITGHGTDPGLFPARTDYVVASDKGCAEFSENFYRFKLNGRALDDAVIGRMYFDNRTLNYDQFGMSHTPRVSWGPGLPVNVQYWAIKEIPTDRRLTLDIDLDEFITQGTYSNYIVAVDLFGFK